MQHKMQKNNLIYVIYYKILGVIKIIQINIKKLFILKF